MEITSDLNLCSFHNEYFISSYRRQSQDDELSKKDTVANQGQIYNNARPGFSLSSLTVLGVFAGSSKIMELQQREIGAQKNNNAFFWSQKTKNILVAVGNYMF